MIFKLSKVIYFVTCLLLLVIYVYNVYYYGIGGDFVWAELVVLVSSLVGLCSFFLRSNLSRLALILSSFTLGLLSAYAALQVILSAGNRIDGSGEIYTASAFEISLPLFIFLLCVSVLACSLVKKGAETD